MKLHEWEPYDEETAFYSLQGSRGHEALKIAKNTEEIIPILIAEIQRLGNLIKDTCYHIYPLPSRSDTYVACIKCGERKKI